MRQAAGRDPPLTKWRTKWKEGLRRGRGHIMNDQILQRGLFRRRVFFLRFGGGGFQIEFDTQIRERTFSLI